MKNRDLDQLATEQRHPHSSDLDTLSSEESVCLLLEEDRSGLESALRQLPACGPVTCLSESRRVP